MSGGPLRPEPKAIRPPSGDHAGQLALTGSAVSRLPIPVRRSYNQMSRPPVAGSSTSTASRRSSGEILTRPKYPGSPIDPTCRPERSIHTRRDGGTPCLYTRSRPSADVAKSALPVGPTAAIRSAMATGCPETRRSPASKGCASSVPLRTNRRRPGGAYSTRESDCIRQAASRRPSCPGTDPVILDRGLESLPSRRESACRPGRKTGHARVASAGAPSASVSFAGFRPFGGHPVDSLGSRRD